jgi:SpoVK/Ycf46/Vps4 family AAA+-type ATPase
LSAATLAGELRFPLFTVLLHGLITKFMGETAQKLRMIFDAVRTTRGVYLFDEIDALAATRGSENDIGEARRILNSFLQFLDEDTGPSIIVATTNLPEILDRAVLRRFDLVLPYEMPKGAAIEKALRRRLTGFDAKNVDWANVARYAEGLSTADVVAAAEDAARRAVLAHQESIETTSLVASLDRRRSLHGIGGNRRGCRGIANTSFCKTSEKPRSSRPRAADRQKDQVTSPTAPSMLKLSSKHSIISQTSQPKNGPGSTLTSRGGRER